ncbi:ABC transporter permease [Aquitalea sp. LB_tupeE]|uniref:ABC transporter permease n=1 Tax=Aquitalea sp. LB_tupeE TaxID=2748078 RepID=UPI0015B96305|nr:ABC transporter permease [Aquitalea sp. LB_tupeE]NWK79979.1 ABC transporter permease [Aquitalea sp. LB_tupeE]
MKAEWQLAWRRFAVMLMKELKQLGRDRVLLAFIVYAFTADIFLAASGVSLSLNHAATLVQDLDHSPQSRELLARFQQPYFRIDGTVSQDAAALAALDQGRAMLVLSVPPQFGRDLANGRPTSPAMQVDTTNSVLGFLATSHAQQIVSQYGLESAMQRLGMGAEAARSLPQVQNDIRVWYNPNQEDSWFMGIAEMLNIATVFAVLLPAAAMVREKERGTVEQLIVSPLSPLGILLPKVVSMTGVILCGVALSLFLVLIPVFAIPMKGSLLLFFTLSGLYVFTTAGLGLFAATIARNLAQAGMLSILILAPMLFLSGAWTPPEAMPGWLRGLMFASPLHYYLDIAFGILLKGQGLADLQPAILGMSGIGVLVFGAGLLLFRRQFD